MRGKKLAIVGSADGRENAPWDDKSFDIWVFNEAAQSEWCRRWDACFQMHVPAIYTGHNTKNPKHWEWLQKEHGQDQVIWMQDYDLRVPNCVAYPLKNALSLIGDKNYLAATVCDAIALCLFYEYEQLHIYGVELSGSEYKYQAECYRFWIGVAIGKLGPENVVLHSGQYLFQAPLYGYEGNFAFGESYFIERSDKLDNEWVSAERSLKNIKKEIQRTLENKKVEKLPELVKSFQEAALLAGTCAGALAEAERYASFGDRGADRGGFEFAAATTQRDGEAKRILMYTQLGKVEYVWNIWKQTNSEQAQKQLTWLIPELGQMAYDTGAQLGMYRENLEYIQKYDATAQANGQIKT